MGMISNIIEDIKSGTYKPYKSDKADRIIIAALKSRRRKEPFLEGDGYADGNIVYDTWRCPNCGQAIKWE